MKNFPLKRKYIYLGLALSLIILGIWWWRRKARTTDTPEKDLVTPTVNGGGNSGTSYSLSACGGIDNLMSKLKSDAFFRNQTMKRGIRSCQVTLTQALLNQHASKSLIVDGIFGPKTEATVQAVFGKNKITLNDVDAKFKITNIQPYQP